jgi:uncharacterized membrane protein YvlD (DUF360 family)
VELVAIVLSGPAAFVASAVYCGLLTRFVRPIDQVRRLFMGVSLVVLGLFAVELVLLTTLGTVRSRVVIGPGFYLVHLLIFFLGTPGLANVLVLGRRAVRRNAAAVLCAVFAVVLTLTQYGVFEALYGVDGDTGPFSPPQPKPGALRVERPES